MSWWQGKTEGGDPSELTGLKKGNIQHRGTTAGPASEFYGMPVNMDRTEPDILWMAVETLLKEDQIIAPAFRLVRG